MDDVSLIRSVVSKEGDHMRAIYNVKTGYRPDPTLTHPAIGSIICHELPETGLEIPNHVSSSAQPVSFAWRLPRRPIRRVPGRAIPTNRFPTCDLP